MAWVLEEDFAQRQFARRPVSVRDTQWADWAPLEALSEVDTGWHVRSPQLGLYGFAGFEGQYLTVRRELHEGRLLDFKVLAAEDGAVVGYALLGRLRRFPGEPLTLDLFVHPSFVEHAEVLAQAVIEPCCDKVLAFGELLGVGGQARGAGRRRLRPGGDDHGAARRWPREHPRPHHLLARGLTMTRRERLLTALRGEVPDRVPAWAWGWCSRRPPRPSAGPP